MKKRYILGIFILFITLVLLYSRFIATSGFVVNEHRVVKKNLPSSMHGLKVVHLSDIHFGRTIKEKELKAIIEEVNLVKPDIVVITGDLFDRTKTLSEDGEKISSILSKVSAKLGKYAITGNHDAVHSFYKDVISASGFVLLDDNYEEIYSKSLTPIIIAGMSSNLEVPNSSFAKFEKLNSYLDLNPDKKSYFKLLIMHEPDYVDKFSYSDFDLILAGHSHNGQIRLPFIGSLVLPVGAKKYYEPYYKLEKTDLFISSGLGTSTVDFRLFNKPSFNLYRIVNK